MPEAAPIAELRFELKTYRDGWYVYDAKTDLYTNPMKYEDAVLHIAQLNLGKFHEGAYAWYVRPFDDKPDKRRKKS